AAQPADRGLGALLGPDGAARAGAGDRPQLRNHHAGARPADARRARCLQRRADGRDDVSAAGAALQGRPLTCLFHRVLSAHNRVQPTAAAEPAAQPESGRNVMPHGQVFPPSPETAQRAWLDAAKYEAGYARSVSDPEGFWAEHGKRVDWI